MSNDIRQQLAVVVPCYNAGDRVRPVIEGLLRIVDHVIVVDDGSTDGAVDGLGDLDARIVALPQNQGKGHAMMAGFRAALEDSDVSAVAIVDADGQHDPGELPGLWDTFVREGAGLVIGSREFDMEHVPWRSRFGNKLTISLTALLLGKRIPDTQSGFRLHSRALLEDVIANVTPGRYESEMEILVLAVRKGYTVVPSPIQTIYEEGNPSSHFNKVGDSIRIYRRLFAAALRFR
jgi:glycosyltransferase involved in cell wall biosynthesis